MNEQQTPGQLNSGTRGITSPGGNSPVMGGSASDLDRLRSSDDRRVHPGGAGQGRRSDRSADGLADRRPQATTMRAEQHPHRSTGSLAWTEGNALPLLVAGLGGGLLFGWVMSKVGGSTDSRHWQHGKSDDYWRQQNAYAAPSSRYGSRRNASIATDETDDLIASDKVEGTAVYNHHGDRLGTVHNFMVGKRSGQVAYAVMSFGGWLGMGESYHPLPWNALTYDTHRGGYVVSLSKEQLRNAPSHSGSNGTFDASYWRRVSDYWD